MRQLANDVALSISGDLTLIIDASCTADHKTKSRWGQALRYVWRRRRHKIMSRAQFDEISPMSEDDPTSERCPICKDKECKVHLLARFDESGDEGELGVELIGGPL